MIKYTCWGAARQVTGSMHLLEIDDTYKLLVDCGLDYENKEEQVNVHFPFEPKNIDAVILTHAHIDHSGNIPNLVKQGFRGSIFCTEPTAYLLDKLWTDSVNIQNLDRKRGKGMPKLYGYADLKKASEQILTWPFYKEFELSKDLKFSFYEAGHILGAASVKLSVKDGKNWKNIGFTGDLGNFNSKLIVDPKPMEDLHTLVTESTYGGRKHRVQRSPEEELKEQVIAACVNRPGRLIIPAFSVGRTQAILFTLKQLFDKGELPPIKVFADSPLGLASTNIHSKFHQYLNEEARTVYKEEGDLFDFDTLYFVEDEDDAEEMEYYRDACIVVSSAGMMDGGRIQHHLQDHIMNPMCTVLIAGFCSPGTIGAKLLDGVNPIRIKNRDRYVYAKILQTDVFSAHPDQDGLMQYLRSVNEGHLKDVYIVHGVEEGMEELKTVINKELGLKSLIPDKGNAYLI